MLRAAKKFGRRGRTDQLVETLSATLEVFLVACVRLSENQERRSTVKLSLFLSMT